MKSIFLQQLYAGGIELSEYEELRILKNPDLTFWGSKP